MKSNNISVPPISWISNPKGPFMEMAGTVYSDGTVYSNAK